MLVILNTTICTWHMWCLLLHNRISALVYMTKIGVVTNSEQKYPYSKQTSYFKQK
jgi:hypothetical protein